LGEDHPDLAVNLANLAGLYVKQGRYAEAEPLYLKAINTFQQRLGSEHPYTTGALECLANLLTQVVREGQTKDLSDHPLIRELLSHVTNQEETKKRRKKKKEEGKPPKQNPRR
jgi:tetratricopeptide (TPR) repeat protein